jgi:hypothetical protein
MEIVDDLPHVRVTLGADNITVTGSVNIASEIKINNTEEQSIPVHLTDDPIAVTGTFWPETQPVSIATMPTTPVTIASMPTTPVTGTFWPETQPVSIASLPEIEIKNDTGNPVPISATTAANSSVNPIYISGAVTTAGGSAQGKLWFFQIAQGLIAGHRAVFKAGYNPSIANNTEESLWSHSVIYPWASWGAGGTLSCVSASASDVGTLYITGLRSSDWTEVSEQVTLNGTTPVVTTNSFIRINSLSFSGADTNVGEIHVYRNGGTVGYIGVGEGQGQMAQFSVPAGHTAYILNGNANMGKGNDGFGKFKYRMYGGSFQTAMTFLLFQSTFLYTFEAPLALPEKSDLDVTMLASVSGTACSCAYSLILIAN